MTRLSLITGETERTMLWPRHGTLILITLLTGALLLLHSDSAQAASVVEEISFETGNIGNFGSPVATGWQFDQFNGVTSIETANMNRPAFTHGTNQETLVLHPYALSPFTGAGPRQGALWEKQFDAADAGAPVEVLDPGEVFYSYTEFFSDVARGNQTFKTNFYFGELGDGVSGQGGFASDSFDSMTGNTEAGWTWGDNEGDKGNMSAGIYESNIAGEFRATRYPIPPTAADLDVNHIGIMVLRQGADAATPFDGSEMELSESGGNFNGSDATNATDPVWGGNPAIITGKKFDKATIVIRRQNASVHEDAIPSSWINPDESNCTGASTPADCIYNAQLGIKYLRFGTADTTDVNLDGATDAADEAIVQANLGLGAADYNGNTLVDAADFTVWRDNLGATGTPGEVLGDGTTTGDLLGTPDGVVDEWDYDLWVSFFGTRPATLFDGDVNNDRIVNGADLALYRVEGAGSLDAVPEPSSLALLAFAMGALAAVHRSTPS